MKAAATTPLPRPKNSSASRAKMLPKRKLTFKIVASKSGGDESYEERIFMHGNTPELQT